MLTMLTDIDLQACLPDSGRCRFPNKEGELIKESWKAVNTYHGVCEKLHENYDLGFHRHGVATSSTCENTGCDPEILVRKIVEYVCDERDEQTLCWDRANSRLSDMETELSTEEKPAATSPTKGHQHQQPQPGATTTAASIGSNSQQMILLKSSARHGTTHPRKNKTNLKKRYPS